MGNEQIAEYIAGLEDTITQQSQALQNQGIASNQTAMMMQQKEDSNLVKEQLELGEDLERLEHLLRGEVIKKTDSGDEWIAPSDRSMIILSEYGVQLIMNAICFYINKNKLLSNYDEQTINQKMEDFGMDLTDTIFMEAEKVFEQPTFEDCAQVLSARIQKRVQLKSYAHQILGKEVKQEEITKDVIEKMEYNIEKELENIRLTIMKNKYKRFILIMRLIQDTIHDTYLRALAGVERRSLRQHINISEVQTKGGASAPIQENKSRWNPLSWRR